MKWERIKELPSPSTPDHISEMMFSGNNFNNLIFDQKPMRKKTQSDEQIWNKTRVTCSKAECTTH